MASCNLMGLDPVDRRAFDREYGDRMAKGWEPGHAMRMTLLDLAGKCAQSAKAAEEAAWRAERTGQRIDEQRAAASLRARAAALLRAAESVTG